MTKPDILTLVRLFSAPVLLVLAWADKEREFIILLAVAYITDAIDGPIARRTHQESELGPKLDTWADVSVYMCVPLGAWWLWPDLIKREILYFIMIIASVIVPMLAGLLKFHKTTSYHTWLVKIAAVCTTISSLALFLGLTAVPFRISAVLCIMAGLEETLITTVITKPGSNLRSLWHVMYDAGSENRHGYRGKQDS